MEKVLSSWLLETMRAYQQAGMGVYFAFSNKIQRNKPEGISRKEIKNGNATVAEEENRFKKKSKGEEKKK